MGIFSGIKDMFKERKVTPEYAVINDDYKNVREPLINWLNQNIGKANTYTGKLTADKTNQESESLDYLKKYTDAGVSDLRKSATGQIQKTLDGEYDPTTSPYYQAVKAEATRNLADTQANIASNAAGAGRYWTGARLGQQSKSAENTANELNQIVYGLQDKERQRQMDVVSEALAAAQQEEQIPLQKATALQTLGSLDRNIQQSQLDALYNEWNRSTNEYPMQVAQLASGVQKAPDRAEVSTLPSTAMGMLGTISPLIGSYNQQKYGYTAGQTSISDLIKIMTQAASFGGMGGMGGASNGVASSTAIRKPSFMNSGISF